MARITRLLPAASSNYSSLLFPGKSWSRLSPFLRDAPLRGVTTEVPSEEVSPFEEDTKAASEEDDRLRKIRDISRLRPDHRNLVHRRAPHEKKTLPSHYTVLFNKRMFGRYGYESGVDPAICWPTKAELDDKKEYEQVAYPYNIMEVAEREATKRRIEEEEKIKRDETVAANVERMLKMKAEFLKKKELQKQEDERAKAFKARLIEEVRLHFNYTVSERDEKFRLEVKERAKQLKEREKQEMKAKKKEKEAVQKAANREIAMKQLKEKEMKLSISKTEEE